MSDDNNFFFFHSFLCGEGKGRAWPSKDIFFLLFFKISIVSLLISISPRLNLWAGQRSLCATFFRRRLKGGVLFFYLRAAKAQKYELGQARDSFLPSLPPPLFLRGAFVSFFSLFLFLLFLEGCMGHGKRPWMEFSFPPNLPPSFPVGVERQGGKIWWSCLPFFPFLSLRGRGGVSACKEKEKKKKHF